MASMPPKKMQSMRDQPNACPVTMPINIMLNTMQQVAMTGDTPILMIFLKEKSRPSEKSRNITPMSPHIRMLALSTTDMM